MNLQLTSREREIAAMIASGAPKKLIAHELKISLDTVMVHTKNLYRKTNSHCTADLTRYVVAASTGIDIQKALHRFTRMCLFFLFMSLQGFMMSQPATFDELRKPVRTRVVKTKTSRRRDD